MQKIVQRLAQTLAWAASTTVSQDYKLTGALTRLGIRISLTASGSMAAAVQEDGIWRIIQSLRVVGSGGINYFSMGSEQIGRMLHLLNMYDQTVKGTGHAPLVTTNDLVLVIHFGSRPQDQFGRDNPFDMTGMVPAFEDNNVRVEWETTANTVVDDTPTISAATMSITQFAVMGSAADLKREMENQGVPLIDGRRVGLVAQSSYEAYAHSANFADLSSLHDVPGSSFLRRVAFMVQDDTATRPLRVDDEVARVGLILPVGNQRIYEDDLRRMTYTQGRVQSLLVDDNATTGGPNAVGPGFGVMDFRNQGNPDLGLDLRGYKTGDFRVGLTIENYASGDDTFLWFDQVRPFDF